MLAWETRKRSAANLKPVLLPASVLIMDSFQPDLWSFDDIQIAGISQSLGIHYRGKFRLRHSCNKTYPPRAEQSY